MKHHIRIRKASTQDVQQMVNLLNYFTPDGLLLPRSEDNMLQHLQEFVVAIHEEKLVGIAALHVYTSTLAEIRSLAIAPAYQKQGVGKLLMEACEEMACTLGITQLFALTYIVGFFEKLGYHIVKKESLPHKIWTVCIHCDKFSHCDEIAVQKDLNKPLSSALSVPMIETVSEADAFD